MSESTSSSRVFEGLNVLDLTNCFAGALATMVMADNGAAVVRIVPDHLLETDATAGVPGARQWHRGKERRMVDLHQASQRDEILELVGSADVLVESYGQSTLAPLGLGWPDVHVRNPRLIYCSIDTFGDHPSLAGLPCLDGIVHAAAGRMADFGNTFGLGRPAYSSSPVAGFGASQAVLQGVCAALHQQHTQGSAGRRIRTSLLRSLTPFDLSSWALVQFPDRAMTGRPPGNYGGPTYITARAKDGVWLQFASLAPHLFWREVELLGLSDLRTDPRFASMPQEFTAETADLFWEQILLAVATKTAAEWMGIFLEAGGVGVDIVRHTDSGMDHPQARFNGNVIELQDPELGLTEQLGPISMMAETPSMIRSEPRAWKNGASPSDASGPTNTALPLSGVTVVEAAAYVAAPLGPVLLSDLGARVIKIEPLEGDPLRGLLALKLTQGKESVAVDLKSPAGVELVHRIIAQADIFIHNYRPGVPKRLGLDYDTLAAINPALIYLYAGAYGETGPYSHMPAFHPIAGAIAGTAALQVGVGTLELEGEQELSTLKEGSLRLGRANEGHPDMTAGCAYASAMLLGLVARDRSGKGQQITATMLGANAYLMSDGWIRYPGRPERHLVDGQLLGTTAVNRLYQASDGWVFLGCGSEADWRALCAFVPELHLADDPKFSSPQSRLDHDLELADLLATTFASRSADDIEKAAIALGLGCVRADRGGFGAFQQSDADEGRREVTQPADDPELGSYWRHQSIVDLGPRDELAKSGSRLGQHTVAVMAEVGYSEAEIARLLDEGVVRGE